MSDLFHKNVPLEFIQKVFDIMNKTPWHTYQVLTKRSDRLKELSKQLNWGRNIWMGVSVENQDYTYRIDDLINTNAFVKFLSIEPLIGPVRKLKLKNIHWVIVGGESGPKARPMKPEWVLEIKDQCKSANGGAGVSFFFKQWGGINKKKTGRLLEGRTWDEVPALKVG
jgi:protein gp37